eukprot:TRINITY_DN26377_c0_g1_i1.p1 TRINITY_DN26377_c0_g1~~TRINITY_DN26377_c0_g1_i1.p1  ORF type:complete len:116 (-),score=6.50 TRINITY_DN26377_c0_g1_i1:277-624(-)
MLGKAWEGINLSKVVITNNFPKGSNKYEEHFDIQPVLTLMEKLWKSAQLVDIQDHMILVMKLHTLIRSGHAVRVYCNSIILSKGYFNFLGNKHDRDGQLTWSNRQLFFEKKEKPA